VERVDLHLHTRASDGELTPVDLVRAAVEGRLDVIAITDHDTVAGVPDALAAAAGTPLRVVPGVEMSTVHDDREVHVLGYGIAPAAPRLLAHQSSAVHRREERAREMVRRLQAMGLRIEFDDVLQAAGADARSIGRPHLARALLANGQVRSFGEAFDRYLGDAGPAFVRSDLPTVREAIDTIRDSGGIAVWAHPDRDVLEPFAPVFAEWGMGGLECFRPSTGPEDGKRLRATARRLGLVPTGGSDWHGPHRAALGDFFIPAEDVREILDATLPADLAVG
jgi:predicted metal-dependent phosphoesterase TrpH